MTHVTESRLAAYEGIIALAWADHDLDAQEQEKLETMIRGNQHFTDQQREQLTADVKEKTSLTTIWPRITEKRDRAFLLNVADTIFYKDGHYSSDERTLYNEYFNQHMATVDSEAVMEDIRQLALAQRAERAVQMAELEEYADQHSFTSRIGRALDELFS